MMIIIIINQLHNYNKKEIMKEEIGHEVGECRMELILMILSMF